MANVKTCDKCGKVMNSEYYSVSLSKEEVDGKSFIGLLKKNTSTKHLCFECNRKIENFIYGRGE